MGISFADKVLRVLADRELSMSQQYALVANSQPTTSRAVGQGAQPQMEQGDHSPLVSIHGSIMFRSGVVLMEGHQDGQMLENSLWEEVLRD